MDALPDTPAKRLRTECPESTAKEASTEQENNKVIESSLFGDSQYDPDDSGSADAGSLSSDANSDTTYLDIVAWVNAWIRSANQAHL